MENVRTQGLVATVHSSTLECLVWISVVVAWECICPYVFQPHQATLYNRHILSGQTVSGYSGHLEGVSGTLSQRPLSLVESCGYSLGGLSACMYATRCVTRDLPPEGLCPYVLAVSCVCVVEPVRVPLAQAYPRRVSAFGLPCKFASALVPPVGWSGVPCGPGAATRVQDKTVPHPGFLTTRDFAFLVSL